MENSFPWVPENANWEIAKGKRFFANVKIPNVNVIESNVLSLTLRGVVRNNMDRPEGLVPADYSTYQIFEKDDLVFKLIDLENIRTSRVGIVPERGIMSSAYIRLIPSKEIYPKYAYWWFYNLWCQNVFNALGDGVRANLSSDDLLELPFPKPPMDEQERIASELDSQIEEINNKINEQQEIARLMGELRAALITEKFSDSGLTK
jgi:type I restriction enzyme S subunit